MATVTMSPTVRRPFASLDATRLDALQKAKFNFMNQQNGTDLAFSPTQMEATMYEITKTSY